MSDRAKAERAHDHENDADRVEIEPLGLNLDGKRKHGADGYQEQADTDAHGNSSLSIAGSLPGQLSGDVSHGTLRRFERSRRGGIRERDTEDPSGDTPEGSFAEGQEQRQS